MKRSVCTACLLAVIAVAAAMPAPGSGEPVRGMMLEELSGAGGEETAPAVAGKQGDTLFLRRAEGRLRIEAEPSVPIYTVYFHVPLAFAEQAPIRLEVRCGGLLGYRFVRLAPPNVVVAARVRSYVTFLDWTAWVLVLRNAYADRPASVPIEMLASLPDSVLPYLQATDCCQVDDPAIQGQAHLLTSTLDDVVDIAQAVCDACVNIPWTFAHSPLAFDAVYALKWGNSCTGHAHAGAALLRAAGVPAQVLHVMPIWVTDYYDMHWIIQYWLPGYGWVRMETSTGQNPVPPPSELVTFACRPHDEFPFFYPNGIESMWHTSDPLIPVNQPRWSQAHWATGLGYTITTEEEAARLQALTAEVWREHVRCQGGGLDEEETGRLAAADDHQDLARRRLEADDLAGYEASLRAALDCYAGIGLGPEVEIWTEDFESGENGWSHGGAYDEWELGSPAYGPVSARSGTACWGTDLDGEYESPADNWLLSPAVDLSDLVRADLSFWTWLWVEDHAFSRIDDPLWVEISAAGGAYEPLCNTMGGVNDDPAIPDVGGWNQMVLDLTPWAGQEVRFRFRFRADAAVAGPGAHLDDLRVTGVRRAGPTAVTDVLTSFAAVREREGTVLTWQAAPGFADAAFRVTAGAGDRIRDVPCAPCGPGAWRAVDPAGAAAAAPVTYAVLARLGDRWQLVRTETVAPVAAATRLVAVAPNPSNPATTVRFALERPRHVRLAVHDLTGRLVAVLADAVLTAGEHAVRWDGRDRSGRTAASGSYLVRLATDEGVETCKLLLVR